MIPETFVFKQHNRFRKLGGNTILLRKAPLPIRSNGGIEKVATAVFQHGGVGVFKENGGQAEEIDNQGYCRDSDDDDFLSGQAHMILQIAQINADNKLVMNGK